MPQHTAKKPSGVGIELPMRREPLCYLTEAERLRLSRACTVASVGRGVLIFGNGERADKLFLVLEGRVKMTAEGIGGRTAIVGMATAMDTIGHRAVLAGERHSTSAVAIDEAKLIVVPRAEALAVLRENPEMAAYAMKKLARELRASRQRGLALAQKQIRGRLADSLLTLRDKYGYCGDTRKININVTREELAQLSNMTTANAIRTLSAFAGEGLVGVSGRTITITDEQGLEKTSQMG